MAQTFTYYPLGNAQTMQLVLANKKRMLFDYANVKTDDSDKRWNLIEEFSDIDNFDVVLFTHAHEDHIKGAADFFRMEYSRTHDEGVSIGELWLSSAFVTDTSVTCEDARVIRQEARERLKERKGIKIFGHGKALSKWLSASGIPEESIKHLIFHAGKGIVHTLGDEVSFFLHAPFSDDCDDAEDKNDPSVVIQMRLHNLWRDTNILITGDTPCDVLDEIITKTRDKSNDEYLRWDIYDVPHHCSNTGLCNNTDEEVTPTDNMQWLLEQSEINAYMVASCKALADAESPPPSVAAAKAYKDYTKADVIFRITMEWPKRSAPEPIVFIIDSNGMKPKSSTSSAYFSSPAPRAGK